MSPEKIPAYVTEWLHARVVWYRDSGGPRAGRITDVFQQLVDGHQARYARVLWDDTGRLDVIELHLLAHEDGRPGVSIDEAVQRG